MRLMLAKALRHEHPGLRAELVALRNLEVRGERRALQDHKTEAEARLRDRYDLDALKDEGRIRAYRDFFWRVGIDPTKIRPASEALLRRILQGKPLPTINTLVDAYNLASAETRVALAAFDRRTLQGDLTMRFAREGEDFLGIGMRDPVRLGGREVVVEDEERLIAVYPYRDADHTKVTRETKDAILMVCGVPGVGGAALDEAARVAGELVTRFCGGEATAL